MWTLRRFPTNSLKSSGLNAAAFRACAGLGGTSSHREDKSHVSVPHLFTADRWMASTTRKCTVPIPKQFSVGCCCLSSKAGTNSDGEEDDELEEGFSELESPEDTETVEDDLLDGGSSSDSTSDSEAEADLSLDTPASKNKYAPSALLRLVLKERGPISGVFGKYFEEKGLNRSEMYQLLLDLRKRHIFVKALQLSEWLEAREDFDFSERDYASRLDLLAKVHGLYKAEGYIEKIPESFRNEVIYRTLLANFVSSALVEKAERLFNKMKDLDFPITVFTFNQMLLLYKRKGNMAKIGDILLTMENQNIKHTLFTYHLLIDTKGQANDIKGMERVVETMKAEGVEPNVRIKCIMAKHYATKGFSEKAELILKEIEGNDLKSRLYICSILLPIYANLGNEKEVERIWKTIESKPRHPDFLAGIQAFGKLKNIKKAEEIFDKMVEKYKKLSPRQCTTMLEAYAQNKMLSKGKELMKRMCDAGCPIGSLAWSALIKLYVDNGEVEKAESMMQKALQQNRRLKFTFGSYMTILHEYSKKGDVHSAEKIFQRIKQAGYTPRARQFFALLQTYINAKVPAYGIRERMKANNLKLNKGLSDQLAIVDGFRKTYVPELLD